MHTDELRNFLVSFTAERVALIERHEAGARVVSHYDFNNTYQYVISREETHLQWLGQSLVELEEPLPKASSVLPVPALPKLGKKVEPSAFRPVLADDASLLDKFSERWRSRGGGADARPTSHHAAGGHGGDPRAPAPVRAGRGRQ